MFLAGIFTFKNLRTVSLLPEIKPLTSQIECELPLDLDDGTISSLSLSSKGLELVSPQEFSAGSVLLVSIIGDNESCQEVVAIVAASEPCLCHPGNFFTTIAFVDELAVDFCACNHRLRGALVLPA